MISSGAIKFGDYTFNARTLIVTKTDFKENIKPNLEIIDETEDISHTGFDNLLEMQELLAKLSDKWIEVRLTAQEVAVNFLAGLLGASDPVFMPQEGVEAPKKVPKIDRKEYVVKDMEGEDDIDEKNNEEDVEKEDNKNKE